MTDASIVVVTTAVVTVSGTICATVASILAAKNAARAATNSVIAADNSKISAAQTADVHKLVNGQFSEQLRKVEESANKLAEAVPTLANITAAKDAKVISDDHASTESKL